MTHERLSRLQHRLVERATHYRDPAAYVAGVRAAFDALRRTDLVQAGPAAPQVTGETGDEPDGPSGTHAELPPAMAWFG